MTLATLLARIAIVVDSLILVISAMVLGPEFVAIAALALVRRRGGGSVDTVVADPVVAVGIGARPGQSLGQLV